MSTALRYCPVLLLLLGASCGKEQENPKPEELPKVTANIPVLFRFSSPQRAQQAIQFTADAPDATTFSWNFGDSDSSTVANPAHTYQRAGSYQVRLRVRSATGVGQYTMTMNIGRPDSLAPIFAKVAGRYLCSKVVEYTNYGAPPVAATTRLPDTILTVTTDPSTGRIKIRNYTLPLYQMNTPWRTLNGPAAYQFRDTPYSTYGQALFAQTSDSLIFEWRKGGLSGGTKRVYYGKLIP